ncbi:transposase [Candidatus Hakubella thermalkaliphila]|uniref:Integrase catalytic domain-containing protein n=3 Tax=Candidatus Hakubella thermalkaliphila TaxID=2754717 RepID=A0A6V8Q6T2_9ACTN|nr:transposase [Candidatus Hakubella thermalkaliphila]GFP40435.1 hypothetical protein HKBW3S47_02131 [Candidatus Hakubella thermalkaliphila]
MDMYSRNQYLKEVREEYLKTKSKKEKARLLDEAEKRTSLDRKYLIRKLKPLSNLDKKKEQRKKRKVVYDGYVKAALAKVWEIFDYPCGQRLEPLLKTQVERLRELGELNCSDEVAEKLKRISPRTIDRKLKHQKEVLHRKRKYRPRNNPLLYQKIPVRAGDWDRSLVGQVDIDLVEHCGSSARGEFIHSLSTVDIASSWWEGEGIMGRAQGRTFEALTNIRKRTPFRWLEMHPDNDSALVNWHLLRYAESEGITFSRSRPYKKNDNSFVDEKNSTHIRAFLGHLRYDTEKELEIINDLYRNELRLYKNFFQPVMKLKEKIREKGKVHRKYDVPKTPYQRLVESGQIPEPTRKELEALYLSLNPAQLKRNIEMKLNKLYQAYQEKSRRDAVKPFKKQNPRMGLHFI